MHLSKLLAIVVVGCICSTGAVAASYQQSKAALEAELSTGAKGDISPKTVQRLLEVCHGVYLCKCIEGNSKAKSILGSQYSKMLSQCKGVKHDLKYPAQLRGESK